MTTLRYVDPRKRRSILTPLMARLGTNRVANFISRHIGWKLDPLLLRLSRGRVASTIFIPTAVLEDADEQVRLWQLADRVFPAFAEYRRTSEEASRTIPLIALELRHEP